MRLVQIFFLQIFFMLCEIWYSYLHYERSFVINFRVLPCCFSKLLDESLRLSPNHADDFGKVIDKIFCNEDIVVDDFC